MSRMLASVHGNALEDMPEQCIDATGDLRGQCCKGVVDFSVHMSCFKTNFVCVCV